MAIQCNLPVQGGMIAMASYVRIESVNGGKNRSTGEFFACGGIKAYVSAAEAAKENPTPLVTPVCQAVKVTNVDITTNVLMQLYTKLATDLAANGATSIVSV